VLPSPTALASDYSENAFLQESIIPMASEQSAPKTDDDIKRVICGETFCHNLLNDGSARASTTCIQYMASLTFIYKLLNRGTVMPPNVEWIRDDIDRLIPLLEDKYKNKGTLCNK
jgi:hypothetical protein